MEKNYKTKKEEMKNEKTAGNAVVFENPEFGKIRTLTDENGEPLFCAKDVCNILGYKRANDAVSQLVNDLDTAKRRNKVPGSLRKDGSRTVRTQQMLYVNESGFYALVLGSKLPTEVKFKNWVTSEVLPQIRKTGGYIPLQQGESDEETIRHAEEILRATLKEKENLLKNQQVQIEQQKKLIGEQDTEIRRLNDVVDEQVVRIAKSGDNIIQLENQVDQLLPKALYTDNVLNSVSCFTTTQIAKELGITAQELNRQLCALHIQYYQSGQYLLYADYAHMGLAKSRTRYSTLADPHCDGAQEKLGTAYTHTYLVWTERGREFIHLKAFKGKKVKG